MQEFESPLLRFAVTGTLIGFYGCVDWLARREGREPLRAHVRRPRWVAPLILASVFAFYFTIRPQGGPWLDGWGNIAGVSLALGAAWMRWMTRFGARRIRQPDVAARMLLYAALPMAVGVASGVLTLTLPAVAVSAWWCRREDQLLLAAHGDVWRRRIESTAHWLPLVW